MKTLKKYVIRTLIVLFVLAAAVGSFFTFVPFSEGMRAGQVIKLSKKGVIFKTHEGELNLMMMPSTNNLGTMSVWNCITKKNTSNFPGREILNIMSTG